MGPARIHEMVAQRGKRCAKNRHLPLPLVRGNPKSGSGRLPTSLHVRIMANRLHRTGFVRWCEYGGRKGKHPLHKHNRPYGSQMGNKGNPKRSSRWGGRAEIKNDFRRQRSNRHRKAIREELLNHKKCRVCERSIGKGKKCGECYPYDYS